MCLPDASPSSVNLKESKIFNIPLKYNKRYSINFGIAGLDVNELVNRQLPYHQHLDRNLLTEKKLTEFKLILLLYFDFLQRQRFEKLKKLRDSQNNLPIALYRKEILSTVKENQVVIIAGDTGCGKSTQVPQYLMAAGYKGIACTQPRRIACISLSKRVAYETLNEYGTKIGYQIRFERRKTEHTKVVFLTEGLLLRQVTVDSSLLSYEVIILDEIHERHLHTDFLLGIMKCLILHRKDVKVILMSATININLFKQYFKGLAPVVQVPGRLHPIKLEYHPIPVEDIRNKKDRIDPSPYLRILQLIDKKYDAAERGDVLIFLSGMSEISVVVDAARSYAQHTNRWVILPLHSTLSVSEQEKVFDFPPESVRKCIVSTNIAETSVTIDGVRFVVDSGKVKEMSYDSVSKLQKLKEFWISQASAEQRKGRAGRTGPGVCFRLYSEKDYAEFIQYSTPEIQRVPLDSVVLQMISMGLPDIKVFPFIEPPSAESLDNSLKSLKAHAALTDSGELTTIGSLLSQLPIDVSLGKMLIMGSLFHQVGPILSLAAALSVQSPLTNKAYRDADCLRCIKALESDHGDPFTLLNALREWLLVKIDESENSRRWCKKRGFEEQRFYEMIKLRHQFSQLLTDCGLHKIGARLASSGFSSSERAQRHGELQQLRSLKKELFEKGSKKAKVLRLDFEGGAADVSDDEDGGSYLDLKGVDFKIKNDPKQLRELYENSSISAYKDIILLKLILCSGLYPQVALADEYNNYKPGSEQLFHTSGKPFTVLHPNSVFSCQPEVLQLSTLDIIELPGFSRKRPVSSKHQLLLYTSLIETNKPYLVNAVRIPAAQALLLFSRHIDTNADFSVVVCDQFLQITFPDPMQAQNFVFQAVLLRFKWDKLLEVTMQNAKKDCTSTENASFESSKLECDLSSGLIDFMLDDAIYSVHRLLAADVKVLYQGPEYSDAIKAANPFITGDWCSPNLCKGGLDLMSFLTYDCLSDTESSVTMITAVDTVCKYCDKELHVTVLERLAHMKQCLEGIVSNQVFDELEDHSNQDPTKKRYYCVVCDKTFNFSLRDIFRHKKLHL